MGTSWDWHYISPTMGEKEAHRRKGASSINEPISKLAIVLAGDFETELTFPQGNSERSPFQTGRIIGWKGLTVKGFGRVLGRSSRSFALEG